jgi:hypothetical protein
LSSVRSPNVDVVTSDFLALGLAVCDIFYIKCCYVHSSSLFCLHWMQISEFFNRVVQL